jgi:ABC-type sugar transport system ATPase subunit
VSTNGNAPVLRLNGIDTYYGQIHILESLNLEVAEGELVSLLGGNASAAAWRSSPRTAASSAP